MARTKAPRQRESRPSPAPEKRTLYQRVVRFGAAAGALLAFLVAGITNWDKLVDWYNGRFHPDAVVDVSYARLFGAVQIPAVMYWSGSLQGGDSLHSNLNFAESFRAWRDEKHNPLANAEFVIGPVGDQIRQSFASLLSQPRNLREPLLAVAFTGDSLHGNAYLYLDRWAPPAMDDASIAAVETRFGPVQPGNPPYEKVKVYLDALMRRTGFLFLQVRNTSTEPLTEVQLRYRIARMPSFGSESWQTEDSIRPRLPSGTAASVDSMYLPNLAPGKTYLIPIAVYNGNEGGYPAAFRSSVISPTEISWADRGTRKQHPIRVPSLERAARVPIPMGWYQQ